MQENIIDYLITHPSYGFEEIVNISKFYMEGQPKEVIEEFKDDLRHSFEC